MEALPTQDEINFYRLFSISSAVGEFIYDNKYYPHFIPSNEYKPFRFWEKQLNIINSESRRVGVTGAKNVGKALALDTPIATPTGWTTMGEIRVGDKVFDEKGDVCNVVAATDIMVGHGCYRMQFSDGTNIVADGDHLWKTWDVNTAKSFDYANPGACNYPDNWPSWVPNIGGRSPSYSCGDRTRMRELREQGATCAQIGEIFGRTADAIQQQWMRPEPDAKNRLIRTTHEIAGTLVVRGMKNHAIPTTSPLKLPSIDNLPIKPYVLGYLLGDGDTKGCGRVACDPRDRAEIMEYFKGDGYSVREYGDYGHFGVNGVSAIWRGLALNQGKYIPAIYMRGSPEQRIAIIQGLIDSDGYIHAHGSYCFSNTNKILVNGFCEIVSSLGCVAHVHHRNGRIRKGKKNTESWEVIVSTNLPLARLVRKVGKAKTKWKREQVTRYIIACESVESVPVRCIQVDSPNHLYLAGKTLIPTHNTIMGVAKLIQKCLQIKGTPTEYKTILVASARTDTMRPLFQDIVDIWRNHWILTHFLERESSNEGVNKNDRIIRIKSPYYIEINGRIPGGAGEDGTGFQMIHPPGDSLAWADEASYISGQQLDNWMRVVAPETEQYISGIPKVTLLGSMLHKVQTEPAYRFSFLPLGIVDNPDYSQETIEQMIEEYGGRQSTRARLVLFGEWVEGLGNFWLDLKLCKKYDDKSFYPFYVARALESSRYNKELLGGALRLPPPPKDTQDIVAGIDYGASVHPTVISIFFHRNDIWYPWGRIQLEKFKPDQQAEVLDWLDDRFNFTTLGIDTFQGGGGVFNFMINKTLYPDKNYEDRLVYIAATQGIPIEVRTETDAEYQARVGLNRNLKPNDATRQQVAEKQRVIPYSMNKIRDMLYGGELFLPEEPDLKEEFAGFTEELKSQPQGRSFIEYTAAEKDQDHILQSWQMFVATLALRKPPKFDKDSFELFIDWYSDGTQDNKVGMVEPGIMKIGGMPGMRMVG